jgi:hypothetical protein
MNIVRASRDPGSYTVDYGRLIEPPPLADESERGERGVRLGLRRAEAEQRYAARKAARNDGGRLPSEVFFG